MKKSIVFLIHISFWFFYLLLQFIILAAATQGFSYGIGLSKIVKLDVCYVLIPSIIVFYSFYFLLFPKFIKTRKIVTSIIYGILISIFSVSVGSLFLMLFFGANIMIKEGFWNFFTEIFSMLLVVLVVGVLSIVIKGFITWYDELKLKDELTLRNHKIELALVKSQLDPHFLFNTINNVDVLIFKDAQLASEYLNKLSDILRFMLFETKTEKIPLSKEIAYIEKYIALQKIRTSNDNFVSFTVSGICANKSIPPMLFIPFIENAFKHVSTKKAKNAITISMTIEDSRISFLCENEFKENNTSSVEHSGLGNDLIRKRIELIYPKSHKLAIVTENNTYKVNLILFND